MDFIFIDSELLRGKFGLVWMNEWTFISITAN